MPDEFFDPLPQGPVRLSPRYLGRLQRSVEESSRAPMSPMSPGGAGSDQCGWWLDAEADETIWAEITAQPSGLYVGYSWEQRVMGAEGVWAIPSPMLQGDNGSAPASAIATITKAAVLTGVATITTSAAHNFDVNEWVDVTGLAPPFAGLNTSRRILTVPTSTTFTVATTIPNQAETSVSGSAQVHSRPASQPAFDPGGAADIELGSMVALTRGYFSATDQWEWIIISGGSTSSAIRRVRVAGVSQNGPDDQTTKKPYYPGKIDLSDAEAYVFSDGATVWLRSREDIALTTDGTGIYSAKLEGSVTIGGLTRPAYVTVEYDGVTDVVCVGNTIQVTKRGNSAANDPHAIYTGQWDALTLYPFGRQVVDNGEWFQSLVPTTGVRPSSDPTSWLRIPVASAVTPDVTVNSTGAAAANTSIIHTAWDIAAGSGGRFNVVRLMHNGSTYTQGLHVGTTRSHTILEGCGDTTLINRYDTPGPPWAIQLGDLNAIAYVVGATYTPSATSPPTTFTASDFGVGDPAGFAAGDVCYLWPGYYLQASTPDAYTAIGTARLCDMHTVVSESSLTVTLDSAISATLGAVVLGTPILSGGAIASIPILYWPRTYYYQSIAHLIHITGDGTGAVAKLIIGTGAVTAIPVTAGGTGYTSAPTVTITSTDGLGSGATATATVTGGAVTGVAVTAGGTGYSAPPTIGFTGGGGSGATATAAMAAGGQPTSVGISAGGTGYTTATATADPPPLSARWLRGGRVLDSYSGNAIRLAVHADAANFAPNTWAYLCKGSVFDEVDGRFVQVIANNASTGWVTFADTITASDWIAGQMCLVPGSVGPITVSNKALTANVVTLTTAAAHRMGVGDFATVAGVGAPFDGVWPVASIPSTTTLTYALTHANVTSAASGGTVTVKDRFPHDVTIRNLQVGGIYSDQGTIVAKAVHNLRLQDVTFVQGDSDMVMSSFGITGCTDVYLTRFSGALGVGNSYRVVVHQSRLGGLVTHAATTHLDVTDSEITWDVALQTGARYVTFRGCTFATGGSSGLSTIDCSDILVENCRVLSVGFGWGIFSPRTTLRNVIFPNGGGVEFTPQATDCVVENVRGATLTFDAGSTGIVRNCPDANIVDNSAGGWRYEHTSNDPLLGFFGVARVAQQGGTVMTAPATYTADAQKMIQELSDALSLYGLRPPFLPSMLAGVMAWHEWRLGTMWQDLAATTDADDANDIIALVQKLGGMAGDLTATGAARPTYQTDGIKFGTTQYLTYSDGVFNLNADFCVYAVVQVSATSDSFVLLSRTGASSLPFIGNVTGTFYVQDSGGGSINHSFTGTTGAAIVVRVRRNAGTVYLQATGMAEVTVGSIGLALNANCVGARPDTSAVFTAAAARMKMVLVLANDPSASDHSKISAYILNTFGVSL